MRKMQVTRMLRDSAGWLITLLAGAALAPPVNQADASVWHALSTDTGPAGAAVIIFAGIAVVAVVAGGLLGRIRVPGKMTAYRIAYPLRMARWTLRELLAKGHPGNGICNHRYPSEAAFIADDPRRRPRYAGGGDQYDYGVWWRGPGGGNRLTWVKDTGELIAVAPNRAGRGEEGAVEIIARIPSETEVEHRLHNWPYASHDLRWVRRRAHGWPVPLPPRGKYWLNEDSKPPTPWPSPPPPSVNRSEGAYVGTHADDHNAHITITITDADGTRPLYHHVYHSPTGYSWGYSGDGPHDLARSILYDRLGYVPSLGIYSQFCNDVIDKLPPDFTLTYKQVDDWINRHGRLFARNPRAEPFDPYAAGGA
jgi:hypothetical protein